MLLDSNMNSARARSNIAGPHKGSKPLQVCGGTLLALVCITLHGCIGTTATAQHQAHPVAATIYSRAGAPLEIDSKPKLLGFNRALGERLQATEATLRPLKARAARLEHRFHVFQQQRAGRLDPPNRKDTTTARRAERNGLLREAQQLRADVERKWQRFGELERNYRSMRRLLPSGRRAATGVPRAWLDHDAERQMALNERVYKNIINLLVQLIECPVNIIHDMVGGGAGEPTPLPPATSTVAFPDGDGADGPAVDDEYTETDGLYGDEQPPNPDAELQEARENGGLSDRFPSSDGWLHEFHF
ncbi:uncharacterized protein LOC131210559 [Anopheles bellator]|uniref:uncharacterized protein LOC131210559 n=1 Tax=Anopheles bellator TaxID=139047 RepID=UPI00264758D1|nr:uncharacterized protein LOC131210559 [Anopheles bellator]